MRLCVFLFSFDEGGGETEFAAEFRLAAGHLAVVGFVEVDAMFADIMDFISDEISAVEDLGAGRIL